MRGGHNNPASEPARHRAQLIADRLTSAPGSSPTRPVPSRRLPFPPFRRMSSFTPSLLSPPSLQTRYSEFYLVLPPVSPIPQKQSIQTLVPVEHNGVEQQRRAGWPAGRPGDNGTGNGAGTVTETDANADVGR